MKLHQCIAVEKGTKNECNTQITAAYHEIQKSTLFTGIARTYEPKNEDGEQFPAERQKVQKRGEELIGFTADVMTKYWDTTLTKDTANCHASADVVVDGKVILSKAPVTFLLFLDKQLGDLATMIIGHAKREAPVRLWGAAARAPFKVSWLPPWLTESTRLGHQAQSLAASSNRIAGCAIDRCVAAIGRRWCNSSILLPGVT